jgi:ATP-dependent Clp protease protease subunit
MADILKDGELYLYGTVGADLWGDGFTALDVVDALAEVGRGTDVSVHLNSGGGYASEGAAIYNALAAHRGHKTIYVDGIAASAASLVAMAGDQIVMRKGSVMMIHDPAGITIGSAADHEKSIESLNALANSFADIYAEKSGKTVKEARADMRSEVWLTGQQAVEQGYATHLVEAEAIEPTMFGYHLYQHPPSYVMMANSPKPPKSEGRARLPTAPAVPPSQTGDNPMAHQPADPKPP